VAVRPAASGALPGVVIVVGIITVGISLALHSIQRIAQDDAMVATASDVGEWAPDPTLTQVTVDPSKDPVYVTVGLTGVNPPTGPNPLGWHAGTGPARCRGRRDRLRAP